MSKIPATGFLRPAKKKRDNSENSMGTKYLYTGNILSMYAVCIRGDAYLIFDLDQTCTL